MRMGDAVTPSNLPNGLDAYAAYIDGTYNDYLKIAGQHPNVPTLSITVFLENAAECFDIENGDGTPAQASTFVQERTQAGVWRPCAYAAVSNMAAVIGNLSSFERTAYRLWSAHYTNEAHICGPNTCGEIDIDMDGTQWTTHGNTWDESQLVAGFFQTSVVVTEVVMACSPVEKFNGADIYTQVVNGHLYAIIVGVGWFDITANAGWNPTIGDFDNTTLQTSIDASVTPREYYVVAQLTSGQSMVFKVAEGASGPGAFQTVEPSGLS